MRSLLRTLAALGLVGVITPVACAGLVLATLIFLPLPATLPAASPTLDSRVTHVVDTFGNEIAIFKEFETAIPVAREDIPQVLKDAVIASEDRSFYSHGGVDLRGTLRALWTDLQSGEAEQGGSTITQQYVRLAYDEVGTERTVARKIREAILASQLDREVDKDEILYQYLQNAYFGEGAYGIGAAAQTYFRKNPRDLTLSEAALLVGVLPAPTAYSPRDNPEIGEQRRQLVLDVMLDTGAITAEQHATASAEHVLLFGDLPPEGQPFTVVLPPEIQQSTQPYFTDYVRTYLEANLPGCPGVGQRCPLLYTGGLRIETTLDPFAQAYAQEEVAAVLDGEPIDLEATIVSVEPPTGFVRAMVGGRDYATEQVNVALSERQPGSTFKSFVLAEAFEQGIQPTDTYSGAAYQVGDYTCGSRGGVQTLVSATTNSVNGVFCRLIEDVTVQATWDMATRLGVSMPAFVPELSTPNALVDAANNAQVYGLATALGAVEVSPLELASAYGVFANHGRRAPAIPVLRVLDRDGNPILDNTGAADAAVQVIAPEIADNVTDVLRNVLTDGTAAGRALADRPAAGKTGTAQDNANSWFVGYTPTLSTAVWFGYRHCGAGPDCQLRNVAGVSGPMTGGSAPARLWQRYMNRALEGVPVTEFTEPAPIPDVRDQVERESRGGFDPGRRRYPDGPPADAGFIEDDPAPVVDIPTTSTSSTLPPSTSSTTRPPGTPTTQPCSGLLCPN